MKEFGRKPYLASGMTYLEMMKAVPESAIANQDINFQRASWKKPYKTEGENLEEMMHYYDFSKNLKYLGGNYIPVKGDISLPIIPDIPILVTATAVSSSQINVSWQVSLGAIGYNVYRDGVFFIFTGVNGVSDRFLAANHEYCYQVSAFNSVGESDKSAAACATTLSGGNPDGITFYYSFNGTTWVQLYNNASVELTDTTAKIGVYTELSTDTYADDFVSLVAAVESDSFTGDDSDPPDAGKWTNTGLILKSNALHQDALGGEDGNVISVGTSGVVPIDFKIKTYIPASSSIPSKVDVVTLSVPGITSASISHNYYTSPTYRILYAGIGEDLNSKLLATSDTVIYLRVTIA